MTATVNPPALTAHDRATRLLALRVLKDWIAVEDRKLRDEMCAELVVGERYSGLLDPADKESLLGFVQLTKARETASVVDPEALLAWVEEHCPSEVITTRSVRPAFVQALLASVKADGGWVDPETSELLEVKGVEVRTGSPTLTVKPTAEADALVAEALAARRLQLMPATAR
ncbi:hypothetical protein [Blastococcus mobilis]|uniref:Uncharacterized protein n=1 Tax=Blastococcus mobilis TaxID=1938746 RepID=A0A238VEE4_9ACTN|nr:hypothetical protein [Blastococcus mobilis]SNR32772.1 hypothetical protein SAMN06272737_10351 [Blastococcus mobilis]